MKMKKQICAVLIAASITFVSSPAFAQTGYVSADLLNVRTAPSVNSEVAEMLEWGQAVTITYGPTMGWYEIYRNGGCYYVNADYIDGGSGSSGGYSETSCDSSSDYSGYDYYEDTSSSGYDYYEDTSSSGYDYYEDTSSYESGGTYLGNFILTAYCSCTRCTSGSGVTASGTSPVSGHTVAMNGVPFGTQLMINGQTYTVEDRGTAYGHVDIYFDNHQDAVNFGMQYADVYQLN